MRELLVATENRGKLKELQLLLQGRIEKVYTLADFPGVQPAVEDGATFAANAMKKAHAAAVATGVPTLADDSGLAVDALEGAPGVRSARFAGEGATDDENNAKLLSMLESVPSSRRTGAFCCALALCFPDGRCHTFEGKLSGVILPEHRGSGGFGYDPLFLVPEYGKTLAELPLEVKNRISHRGVALAKFIEYVSKSEDGRS